ncbi:MAG: hypothetical protein KC684_02430 [Candidatus Omnitrophica bacterium]|nr:hypothetical protein [Candidatus Omnitrophota bacterium]
MFAKISNKISGMLLAATSVILTGCGGGGGGGSLGNLFSGADVNALAALDAGNNSGVPLLAATAIEEASLAAVHNPEPASVLLIGGGVAAMTYFKNKSKFRKRS